MKLIFCVLEEIELGNVVIYLDLLVKCVLVCVCIEVECFVKEEEECKIKE